MSVSNMFREEHDDMLDETVKNRVETDLPQENEPEPSTTPDVSPKKPENPPLAKPYVNKFYTCICVLLLFGIYYTIFGVASIDFICLSITVLLTSILLIRDWFKLEPITNLSFMTHLSFLGCELLWLTRLISLLFRFIFYFGFSNTIAIVYAITACVSFVKLGVDKNTTLSSTFSNFTLSDMFSFIDVSVVKGYIYTFFIKYLRPILSIFFDVMSNWGNYLGNNNQSTILKVEVKKGTFNKCINLAGSAYQTYTLHKMNESMQKMQNLTNLIGLPQRSSSEIPTVEGYTNLADYTDDELDKIGNDVIMQKILESNYFDDLKLTEFNSALDDQYKNSPFLPNHSRTTMSKLNTTVLDLEDSDDDLDMNLDTLDSTPVEEVSNPVNNAPVDREEVRRRLRQKMAEKKSSRIPQRHQPVSSKSSSKVPPSVLSALPPELHAMTEILMKGNNLDNAMNMIKREQSKEQEKNNKELTTHIKHISHKFNEETASS